METPERNSHYDIEELYRREGLKAGNGIENGNTGRKTAVRKILKGARMGWPGVNQAFRGVQVEPPLDKELEERGVPTEEIFVEDLASRIEEAIYYDNLKIIKKAA